MIGSSKDLVHWSYPGSGSSENVGVTTAPAGSEKYGSTWDMVAPDFMVDDDGTVWIVVSLGYYASWHNDSSQNDIMQPYLIKATGLKPGADPASNPGAPPIVSYSECSYRSICRSMTLPTQLQTALTVLCTKREIITTSA